MTSITDSTDNQPNDGRKYDVGHVMQTNKGHLECVSVGYHEDEQGKRHNFVYSYQDQDELNEARAIANPTPPAER
jgi:hypothetical protein